MPQALEDPQLEDNVGSPFKAYFVCSGDPTGDNLKIEAGPIYLCPGDSIRLTVDGNGVLRPDGEDRG